MINEDYIIKYLKHELSEEEADKVIEWLNKDKANQDFLFSIKEAYLLSNYEKNKAEAETEQEWGKIKKQLESAPQRTSQKLFSIKRMLSYAAITIICFFIGWQGNEFYKANTSGQLIQTIETGNGQQVKTTLPDGSTVYLNACTQLRYTPYNWEHQRTVQLKGEAIFNITPDKSKPFIVETGKYNILVTGTNFNVSTYAEDKLSVTTLISGKVEIYSSDKKELIAGLSPGESLLFDNSTQKYRIEKLSIHNICAWNRKEILFEGNTLAEKQGELTRHYGYTFHIPPEIAQLKYKATITNESLTEFLTILSHITPDVKFKIAEQEKSVLLYVETKKTATFATN